MPLAALALHRHILDSSRQDPVNAGNSALLGCFLALDVAQSCAPNQFLPHLKALYGDLHLPMPADEITAADLEALPALTRNPVLHRHVIDLMMAWSALPANESGANPAMLTALCHLVVALTKRAVECAPNLQDVLPPFTAHDLLYPTRKEAPCVSQA